MGALIVKRYPTVLFAKAADHTYVECGTGAKARRCLGGKSGGTVLRQGHGSTKRADSIAQPDEKAGIECYLLNGGLPSGSQSEGRLRARRERPRRQPEPTISDR